MACRSGNVVGSDGRRHERPEPLSQLPHTLSYVNLDRIMTDQDGCPLCGSTRFTVEPIDVSSGGRVRHVPGLRSCLDCQDGGAPVLLGEVENERLRGLLARLEWAGQAEPGTRIGTNPRCPVCRVTKSPHDRGCWLAAALNR